MKRQVLATVFALSLLGGGSAFAQDDHHDGQGWDDHHGGAQGGGERHGGGDHHGGPQGTGAPTGAAGQHAAPTGAPTGAHVTSGPVNPAAVTAAPTGPHMGGPQGNGWHGGNNHNGGQPTAGQAVVGPNVAPQQGGAPGDNHNRGGAWGNHNAWGGAGAWNHGQNSGQARERYDSRWFPRQITPDRRFRWQGHWTSQPGFYYRHWRYGQRLPWGWFGSQWYIDDYDYYDLPAPPWGYEWVRVGPDALLVDVRTGLIVETVYGLFY